MVEYLHDAIKAVAGQDIVIHAFITDDEEQVITENCSIMLHDQSQKMIADIEGQYLPENLMWEFTIPAAITTFRNGRHWYCIQHDNKNMCFLQPIYLV